jgi:hypothetical protein
MPRDPDGRRNAQDPRSGWRLAALRAVRPHGLFAGKLRAAFLEQERGVAVAAPRIEARRAQPIAVGVLLNRHAPRRSRRCTVLAIHCTSQRAIHRASQRATYRTSQAR